MPRTLEGRGDIKAALKPKMQLQLLEVKESRVGTEGERRKGVSSDALDLSKTLCEASFASINGKGM